VCVGIDTPSQKNAYTRFENLALDSMAQYTPDDAMIDAAYANSAVNFDTEEF
jgi:hypothetical protein